MVQIKFTSHSGKVQQIEARGGLSVMEAAVQQGVDGIDGECGGACSCATCHVYVASAWLDKVGAPGEIEAEMLEMVDERRPNSRLSCQIKLTQELDGLEVTTPSSQQQV